MFVYKTLISEEPHGALLKGQCPGLKGEFLEQGPVLKMDSRRKRKIQTETEKETDRRTDRQTDRQTDTHTHSHSH